MPDFADTIFALATSSPPRSGSGIAIVRLSGPDSWKAASTLTGLKKFLPRQFTLSDFSYNGQPIDHSGLIYFPKPNSYTGEDIVEFHLHGGMSIIKSMFSVLIDLGLRPAEPGEFTRRAFLNGKMDLTQAEAVARIVSSSGESATREGVRQRAGSLRAAINSIRNDLRRLLGNLEVVFDYPEEVEDSVEEPQIISALNSILEKLNKLLASHKTGKLLSGIRLAIIGKPNVGKSSLLNAILNEDRAIVTETPGTTRDVVSGSMLIDGFPFELLDTAGIRKKSDTTDSIELQGIERSWREVEKAHVVLIVLDYSSPVDQYDIDLIQEAIERTRDSGAEIIFVRNKNDLPEVSLPNDFPPNSVQAGKSMLDLSAKSGDNIGSLVGEISSRLDLSSHQDEIIITESRQNALIGETVSIIENIADGIKKNEVPQDIAATELWGADRTLGRILGDGISSADLDEIFSHFCIGK
ncbi:MAG TPA: tRNA uridine-5-carboxymethylaminomethyl(34) synthesis GTPase MnmE [bacterium]|jgi:tRNA modification GTPase